MKMLTLPALLLASWFAVAALPLRADTVSHRQAVVELTDMLRTRELILQGAQTAYEPQLQALAGKGVPTVAIEDLRTQLGDLVKKIASEPEMMDGIVGVYQRTFTEDEIRELLVFYKSPVGKKTISELPKVMQEGAQIGQQAFGKHQKEFADIVKAVMEKHQIKTLGK